MDQTLRDLAAWTIEQAKAAGANDSKVNINYQRLVEIEYRDRRPQTIKEATTRAMSMDIFVDGRYSNQSTSDLRKEALLPFIKNAVVSTKLLAEDPYRSLPDPKYYKGRQNVNLGILDPSYESLTTEQRHDLVKELEDASLTRAGSKVISVEAGMNDGHFETLVMSSNGLEGTQEGTYFVLSSSVTLQDEGDRRPQDGNYAVASNRKKMPSAQQLGTSAAERALNLLGGKKIKTETLPVIIENQGVGRLLGGLITPLTGGSIHQKRSFLADKKDKKIFSDLFTVIDNPLLPGGLSSQLFDGDGFATQKRTIFDQGTLKDFYIDWYYSRKLGWEPTTGGPSNIVIPPGKRSVQEIMKDLGRGIFVTGFIGGNSNSTTGDTSVGILGQLFENGEPVQAIAEMNVAGNHLQLWNKLIEVANDPYEYSQLISPSLVLSDVVVSGL